MSGSPLEGLNIVYPPVDNSQASFDLANPAHYPELDAQLDLWTNLAFQSDEPFVPRPLSPTSDEKNLSSYQTQQLPQDFDINSLNFFNQFSIDPFLVPPTPNQTMPPTLVSPVSNASLSPTSTTPDKPSAKRPRTARKSVSSSDKPTSPEADPVEPTPDESGTSNQNTFSAAAMSAAEDKRRRNTAASARFRAKKKEREAALEKRSKELESRVSELERECESLRRENGWLKGLVVGVTGASTGAASTSANMANVVSQGTKRKLSVDEKPAVNLSIENNPQSL